MIQDTLQQKSIEFLKAGNREDSQILRDVIAEIKNKEIDLQHPLTDAEVITLMQKMVKKLEEANEEFQSGGRDDLAEENEHEIELLKQFLPAELTDEEIEKRVRVVIAAHPGVERGPLTGMVIKELAGVAESSRIARAVAKVIA